jgi:glutathione synthase/RimK-type ligase-like ATP-grasp enzyme
MHVALASCRVLPEPDPDAEPLSAALVRAGIEAEVLAWDDPSSDWSRATLTVLRSTWNYPQRPDDFLAWAARAARVTDLWNPLEVVRWNIHKRYLLELERQQVPIAPTVLVPREDRTSLATLLTEKGWTDAVVKPAVSAASFGTLRVTDANRAEGEAHLASLVAERDVLVQRYLSSVEDYGERAIIWVDGKVTHAVRKSPRFAGADESISAAVPIRPEEAALAMRAVAGIATPALYARIDVAPGPDGTPVIMELELIEPSLYFAQGPEALERLVAAIQRRLRAR